MIVDTSGLLAAFDPSERMHAPCAAVLRGAEARPIVSPYVVAELDYLLTRKRGIDAGLTSIRHLGSGSYLLACIADLDLARAADVIERYRDLHIGVTDASLVVLAGTHKTHDLLTLDERHFRTVLALDGKPFRLLPADLAPSS